MMNVALESKQTRYGKLAKDVDEFVKNADKAPALDGDIIELKEVNLWTYWQGRGAGLSPKLLVVGQDWGATDDPRVRPLLENVRRMNSEPDAGLDGTQCLDGIEKSPFPTDNTLGLIFSKGACLDIFKRRCDSLFFTNLILGYRRGKSSGGSVAPCEREKKIFAELVDILHPKGIVCLGKDVFVGAMSAGGVKVRKSRYSVTIDGGCKLATFGGREYPVYPVAHCGSFVTMNRCRYIQKHGPDLFAALADLREVHLKDWAEPLRCLAS